MNTTGSPEPRWIGTLYRVYALALRLYPRRHRQRWGADMQQVFRDRCLEAASAGRGPWRVLLADFFPDLAASVGRECIASITEAPPMKRYLLIALMFALFGAGLFHAQLAQTAQEATDVWKQHKAMAAAQALQAHQLALAAAVERDRRGASDDVTAAMLYWSGADGRDWRDTVSGWPRRSPAESAARTAQLDRADAAFIRALKSDDRQALWLAVMDCPARAAVCAKDASLARLREVDAGNGATWFAELLAALDAHDATRARNALARFAQSTQYDTHYADVARGLMVAFDKLPLPPALDNGVTDPGATPQQLAEARRIALGQNQFSATMLPGYRPLLDYCRTRDVQVDAERADDCAAVGKLMVTSSDSMELEVMIGLRAWLRAAPPAMVAQVQQRMRDERWILQGLNEASPKDTSASSWLQWKSAWMAGGGERTVAVRLMQLHGIALSAPADFQMEAKYLDPAY